MSLKIRPLKAFHGDSLLLSFENEGATRNILIDGGTGKTYSQKPKVLKTEIEQIKDKGENIDLMVITHIDDDHIGGIVRMFKKKEGIAIGLIRKLALRRDRLFVFRLR